ELAPVARAVGDGGEGGLEMADWAQVHPCATAADHGETASLMPVTDPFCRRIKLGQAKLTGTTECSTRSTGPSCSSAAITSFGSLRSAWTSSGLETSMRGWCAAAC